MEIVWGWRAEVSWVGWVSVELEGLWSGLLSAEPPWFPEDQFWEMRLVSKVAQCLLAGCLWMQGLVWEAGPLCRCEKARRTTNMKPKMYISSKNSQPTLNPPPYACFSHTQWYISRLSTYKNKYHRSYHFKNHPNTSFVLDFFLFCFRLNYNDKDSGEKYRRDYFLQMQKRNNSPTGNCPQFSLCIRELPH